MIDAPSVCFDYLFYCTRDCVSTDRRTRLPVPGRGVPKAKAQASTKPGARAPLKAEIRRWTARPGEPGEPWEPWERLGGMTLGLFV
jgi:hypothetical protein